MLAFALYAYAVAINVPSTLAERLALTAEMAALAERSAASRLAWYAAYHRFGALLESGDIAGAEQMLDRLEELTLKLRQNYFSWATAIARAMLMVMHGAPDAEQAVQAAFASAMPAGSPTPS